MKANVVKLNPRAGETETGRKMSPALVKAIVIAVTFIVIAAVAWMIYVNTDAYERNQTAIRIGDEKVSVAEYNYFYSLTFNAVYSNLKNLYGETYASQAVDTSESLRSQQFSADMTWHEYIVQQTNANIANVYMLCAEGEKAHYILTSEQSAELNDRITGIDADAENAGASNTNQYLTAVYGRGVNVEVYTKCLTKAHFASCYSESVNNGITVTEDDIKANYEENKASYDSVTFRAFEFPIGEATDDEDSEKLNADAKAKAEAMADALCDTPDSGKEQKFVDLAYENADNENKEKYADPNYTLNQNWMSSSISGSYADWLFDDERVYGDVAVLPSDSYYFVLMYQERTDPFYDMVDIRHILLKPGTDSEATATDFTEKEWTMCEEEVQKLLEEWKAGEATEESFAALATEKSEDPGSAENGGLYENVYKGQMLKTFNDWCFDASRQPGDTGIVRTDYGYHLMYFVGTGDNFLTSQAESAVRTASYQEWETGCMDQYAVTEDSTGMRYVGK